MARFICWLRGHRWHMYFTDEDWNWACKRCGREMHYYDR